MRSLLGELRRRHVFRMAVMYAAAGAGILAVAMDVASAMDLPGWVPRAVIFITILGFPLALVVAWVFDLTPSGVKRTDLSLSPASWDRVPELLEEALELPPRERNGFLRRECAGDPALYGEVRSLLAAHGRAGSLDRLSEEVVSPLVAALHPPEERTPELPAPPIPPLHSRYEILQEVASGGMGVVYRARDVRLDRVVALKFLSSHLSRDPEAKTRFLVEARSAAALDHPNICTIHEVGETGDGGLFIAMPFYAGETVKERIARGPVEAEDAIGIALQVARGLSRAHDHGILHRDIKPANLVLSPDGVVKIVDFGLAKRPEQELTRSGSALGTVAYMSPEQARGEPVDERTDLWSLGVVLYEMLTGARPFRGETEHAVLREIVEVEPPSPGASRPGIPPALDAVVRKALSKDPDGRYASAAEFARALEEARVAPAADAPPEEPREASRLRGFALAPEGEHRQAAVVVSHVEGYARLIECLLPEEMSALSDRIRAETSAVAEKHGGTLNRFDEEVIVLLFGLPATHEDDSVRAARAVLELHERLREVQDPEGDACRWLRLRSGLHAGSVIARPTEDGEGAFRITGEVLRIAERLAGRAEPDQVLASPESARLIAGSFQTEPGEPVELRSGSRPVVPRRILGERDLDPLEALEREALAAFAGRERELAALRECLEAAVRGEGKLVTVVGEAGAGKSRLLHELRVGLDPVGVRLVQSRCRPSADGGAPYHVFIEALRSGIGLPPATAGSHDPDLVVAKLRAAVPDGEAFLPLYLHFLSIHHEDHALPKHLEGEQLRNALQEALAAFFTLLAQRAPTALLIEDWHWADDASEGVLRQLGDIVPVYPLLLVVTSRLAEFPDWSPSGQPTPVYLPPLPEGPALSIVASVLGAEEVDEELGRLVCERTGGNPFFIEEICHALREEGAVRVEEGRARLEHPVYRLRLPETVQAVIRARLDRVEPAAREVVRVAAAIGRDFTRPVLERTLGDEPRLGPALETLKSLGLVQQIRLLPDAAFRFRHALTQEVAYESLLERQRRALHRRVGEAMEAVYSDRLEEHLDALAHHFSRGEEWPRAARYGLGAAERAEALCEFQEALKILERVEEWVTRLPEGEERKGAEVAALLRRERLCEILGLRGAQQEAIERLLSVLEPGGEPGTLAEVYLRRGDLRVSLRRFEDAREDLQHSLAFARQCGSTTCEYRILRSLGILLWHEGRHDEAVEQMEEALSLARREGDTEAVVGDLTNLGGVLKDLGWDDRARACLEEALELTGDVELPIKRYYTLYHLALLQRSHGELDSALASLQEAYDLARSWPLPAHFFALTAIAQIHLQQGRIEEALAVHRSAVEHSRRAKHADVVAEALRTLGDVLIGLDRHAEALPPLEEAASLFAGLENRESEARVLGRIAAAQEKEGNHAGAAAAWQQARELYGNLADVAGELEALEGLARALRLQGEVGDGRECLRQARELARALGDRKKEGSILNSLGIAEWSLGEHERALAHYEQALGIFQSLDDPVHAGFLLNSIGATLNSLGRPAEAVGRLEQAVSLHLRTGRRLLEGHALAALGEAYTRLGKPELALRAYEDSLAIRQELADRRGEGWMLYQIASLRIAERPSPEREEVLARAETIAAEIGDEALAAACSGLSR